MDKALLSDVYSSMISDLGDDCSAWATFLSSGNEHKSFESFQPGVGDTFGFCDEMGHCDSFQPPLACKKDNPTNSEFV